VQTLKTEPATENTKLLLSTASSAPLYRKFS
jgi:hypothetical protein